jgi:hypothetical protein
MNKKWDNTMFRYMFVFLIFALTIPVWSQSKSVQINAISLDPVFSPGTSIPVASLNFTNIVGQAKISSITILQSGTATPTDIPTASLYDDINQDGSPDNLITSATFSGGTATFSGLTNQSLSATVDWIIVYDIASGANPAATADCSFGSANLNGSGGTAITLVPDPFNIPETSLPVTLTSFAVNTGNNQITLKWVTESEVNNLGFELLRSVQNADDFVILSSYQTNPALQGQGNTNTRTEYSYTDNAVDKGVTYWYKLVDVDYNGLRIAHGPISAALNANAVNGFDLHQNYPNPFNPSTTISFSVPNSEKDNLHVVLSVFNSLGQEVATIFDGLVNSGNDYVFNWDGRDKFGRRVASGVYTYSLRSESFVSSMKMVLLK